MRSLAEYVMSGRRQAIIAAIICSIIPFFGWLGVSIMALVTLRNGIVEGGLVLFWITLPALIFSAMGIGDPLLEGIVYVNLVVFMLAAVLRQTSSWSAVLQVAALLGVVGVMIAHQLHPDLQAIWLKLLNGTLVDVKKQGIKLDLPPHDVQTLLKILAKIATGVQASILLASDLFVLLFARWWQAMLYNPGGLGRELCSVRLEPASTLVLVAVVLLALNGSLLALDILPLIAFLFLLAGLSFAHRFAVSKKAKWAWLCLLYGLLILLFPQVSAFLIVVGCLDAWINLRARLDLKT